MIGHSVTVVPRHRVEPGNALDNIHSDVIAGVSDVTEVVAETEAAASLAVSDVIAVKVYKKRR